MDILHRADVMGPIGPLVTTFLLGFTTFILLFWYSSRKQNYWKKLGVPHAKPYPFIGSVWENFRKPLHDVEEERYKRFGRIYGHYEGNHALLSVAEPEILRDILVKDFPSFSGRRRLTPGDEITDSFLSTLQGEDWKRVRTIVTPTFTTGKIKRMISIFKDCSQTLVKNFRQSAEKGEVAEAKRFFGAFSMDMIVSAAFSTKIDSHNDPNNPFVKTARGIFTQIVNWRLVLFTLFPGLANFLKISIFKPKSMKFFKDSALRIIEERKRTRKTRNDFLQLLMDTAGEMSEEGKLDLSEKENDITENYGKEEKNDHIFKGVSKKNLSFNELVAQCVVFFLAGYDSTASTLAFATYLLALHPNNQERLIQELDEALRKSDGDLTYETVQSLKYLDNVISETLRLYPPGARIERVADESYKLQNPKIVIPKGMIITIPVYAMHRDPKNFPEPEKFDPDRFNPEERAKQKPYTYMPFGVGPRNCVAMRFALMQVKMCLAHIFSNFRVKRCPQTKVPLDWYMSQGILQPKDITVKFEIRKDTVKAF